MTESRSDYIVEEFDRILKSDDEVFTLHRSTVQSVFDEIVRLQQMPGWIRDEVRADTLEEAAKVCEDVAQVIGQWHTTMPAGCHQCAAAIRALKEKRDE